MAQQIFGVWIFGVCGACAIRFISNVKGFVMATTAMVHVRLDEQLKAQSTETLASMGLTVSDAARMFLMRVVEDK